MAEPAMISRPQRRIPAILAALALLAAGVAALWVAIEYLASGATPAWFDAAHGYVTSLLWGAWVMVAASIALVVLALVTIVSALKPGRATGVVVTPASLADGVAASEVVLSRRALARIAASITAGVDGVDRVSTSVSSRAVRIRVSSAAADPDSVRAAVVDAVKARLGEIKIDRPLPVSARVTSTR